MVKVNYLSYDPSHLIQLYLHICHQFKLGTGTIQVMSRSEDPKICIPVKMICQESDATFVGHQLLRKMAYIQALYVLDCLRQFPR